MSLAPALLMLSCDSSEPIAIHQRFTMRLLHLLPFSLSVGLITPVRVHAQADTWWRDVTRLAHDSMRGRDTGSPEHKKAARYIANSFRESGLTPGAAGSFLQSVAFVSRTVDESQSSLVLVRDGREIPLTLGEDASFVLRTPLAASLDAPVVFVGYGLSLPEYGVDDLAGLDLKGKVVAFLSQMPKGVPGPVISHSRAQAWRPFANAARSASSRSRASGRTPPLRGSAHPVTG